ncbi:MAG: hypothetical protein PHX83_17800, partial [Acidobacteriia bacterium]|nr:hypothetical protein [Terriglobia bacterium]
FHEKSGWGTVAQSRDPGLYGRRPVFRTIRQLVRSYVEPYVDATARITGYGVADLRRLVPRCNWRLSERNVWAVEKALIRMPHHKFKTSDKHHAAALKCYLAHKQKNPDHPPDYYAHQDLWM